MMPEKFLSCDWGTSFLRLRLIDIASEKIIAESFSHEGIVAVNKTWKNAGSNQSEKISFYLFVLQKNISSIENEIKSGTNNIPLVISGMISATIGMIELPYAELPFLLNGDGLQYKHIESTQSFLHDIIIISGARTDNDVMRGEETQLIGCFAHETIHKQIFIFPGTHSKHITVENGYATDILTYMTGEFFELLANKSILSDGIEANDAIESNENKIAFEDGVRNSADQNLLHSSFIVRTNQLFRKLSKTENYFYLSGLLIGSELAELLKKETETITIVANEKLNTNYMLALNVLKFKGTITIVDSATATIRGQIMMYKRIFP